MALPSLTMKLHSLSTQMKSDVQICLKVTVLWTVALWRILKELLRDKCSTKIRRHLSTFICKMAHNNQLQSVFNLRMGLPTLRINKNKKILIQEVHLLSRFL